MMVWRLFRHSVNIISPCVCYHFNFTSNKKCQDKSFCLTFFITKAWHFFQNHFLHKENIETSQEIQAPWELRTAKNRQCAELVGAEPGPTHQGPHKTSRYVRYAQCWCWAIFSYRRYEWFFLRRCIYFYSTSM